jgi:isocitrate/isopropylmalate dehydrogenase
MMLDHIGEPIHAGRLRRAVFDCVGQQDVTPDLGGTLSTEQVTDRILSALEKIPERK